MNMKIHTRGWKGSMPVKEREDSTAMLDAVVEIDGVLIDMVSRVRVLAGQGEVTSVMVRFIPGTLETIAHTEESWKALWPE